jgi:hypothetical protein
VTPIDPNSRLFKPTVYTLGRATEKKEIKKESFSWSKFFNKTAEPVNIRSKSLDQGIKKGAKSVSSTSSHTKAESIRSRTESNASQFLFDDDDEDENVPTRHSATRSSAPDLIYTD